MDVHKKFTEWAVARGVKINGIAAQRFPDKGVGIIAEKELEVCKINIHTMSFHVLIMSWESFPTSSTYFG
jgi:hypothetical protein